MTRYVLVLSALMIWNLISMAFSLWLTAQNFNGTEGMAILYTSMFSVPAWILALSKMENAERRVRQESRESRQKMCEIRKEELQCMTHDELKLLSSEILNRRISDLEEKGSTTHA